MDAYPINKHSKQLREHAPEVRQDELADELLGLALGVGPERVPQLLQGPLGDARELLPEPRLPAQAMTKPKPQPIGEQEQDAGQEHAAREEAEARHEEGAEAAPRAPAAVEEQDEAPREQHRRRAAGAPGHQAGGQEGAEHVS